MEEFREGEFGPCPRVCFGEREEWFDEVYAETAVGVGMAD